MFKGVVLPRSGFDASVGLPAIKATWTSATVNALKLKQYQDLLALNAKDTVPILYPHVMAGSMHMRMQTHGSFPIRLLGAVHLKNRIIQHSPLAMSLLVLLPAQPTSPKRLLPFVQDVCGLGTPHRSLETKRSSR